MNHFLGGHHPVLAIVIAVACLPVIYWMISQFTDNDRLNAEAGLPNCDLCGGRKPTHRSCVELFRFVCLRMEYCGINERREAGRAPV